MAVSLQKTTQMKGKKNQNQIKKQLKLHHK